MRQFPLPDQARAIIVQPVLNGRLYRTAFMPFVLALAVAALSLGSRPRPLSSNLAPDAFDAPRAFAEMSALAAAYPHRRPGSSGDDRLAAHITHALEGLGGSAGAGFTVRTRRFAGRTIDSERTLTTVIAERPGATAAPAIVILAHRDAAGAPARAELSGTAALLELARVFSARATQRTIELVSTSGGSGGDAGAADFIGSASGPFDAAIVLGDLASARERAPVVAPYSDGWGSAPLQLQRTISAAIMREVGKEPAAPSLSGQLAHLAFPFAIGEQGPLDRAGVPAVMLQASGERGPAAGATVSERRLEALGRAALSSIGALDAAPDVSARMQTGLLVSRKVFPGWAARLLLGTLLLPPLLVGVDALARARRRGARLARWLVWTLACGAPFLLAALFARLLGATSALGQSSLAPPPPSALSVGGGAVRGVAAVGLVLALAWLAWPALLRGLRLPVRPGADAAGVAVLFVLLALCVWVWAVNPFAVLLLLPAAHLWLLVVSPESRPARRGAALAIVAAGLLPLALLIAFYARDLGLGPGAVAWTAVLLLAGGHVGVFAAVIWSLALGCAAALALVALQQPSPVRPPRFGEEPEITMRGPITYAGPGSLGGTESALRR